MTKIIMLIMSILATTRVTAELQETLDAKDIPDQANNIKSIVDIFDEATLGEMTDLIQGNEPVNLPTPRKIFHTTEPKLRNNFDVAYFSFCPETKISSFECTCNKEYKDITAIKDSEGLDDSAIILALPSKKKIAVSYRPTFTSREWIEEKDFNMTNLPNAPSGVKVHKMMYEHLISFNNRTMQAMSKLLDNPEYKDYKLLLTGYSLGASIATLSAPEWKSMLLKRGDSRRIQVLAYSGARVGNEKFVKYIEKLKIPITRYTNRNDIISQLPPRSNDFVHAGVEFHEETAPNGKSVISMCSQDFDEDPSCGWNERKMPSALQHAFPFNKAFLAPPSCDQKTEA